MSTHRRDSQQHTYADYLTWSGCHGEELIDGVAYIREPPAPSRLHQEIVGGIYYEAAAVLKGSSCRVYIAPFDVRLPRGDQPDDQTDTVVQPDVLIVCDLRKLDDRGMRGVPDWIVEVLSPGTASYDQITKLPRYERAGVPEVWLVHPADRTLTIYRLEAGHYGRPVIVELKGVTAITAVPGVSIDWDRVLSNIT